MKAATVSVLVSLGLAAAPAGALSVRSPAKEIVLDGLQIGGKYSLARESGGQTLANTGGEQIKVRTRLVLPARSELSDGYEPLPSLSWIRAGSETHVLEPGQQIAMDASIAIPKRRGLEDAQYQVQWISDIQDGNGAKMSLTSRLLLDLQEEDGDNDSSPQKAALTGLTFAVSPGAASVADIPLGQAVDLESEKRVSLKIINPSDEPQTFALAIERNAGRDSVIKPGYEPAPNPHFLSFKRRMIKVGAGKVGIVEVTVTVPNEGRYRGRQWYFVPTARLRASAQTQSWILYVATSREEAK
jgi:hypothetical protein